jgi:hypothetical protein
VTPQLEGERGQQRLYALNAWREAPFFSDRERAALEWTEAIARVADAQVPDEVYNRGDEELERLRPKVAPEHESIEERAHAYADRVHAWLESRDFNSIHDPADPRAVIAWFQYSIPAKIHRALHGLAHDDPNERDWPADSDGSAKVALPGTLRGSTSCTGTSLLPQTRMRC